MEITKESEYRRTRATYTKRGLDLVIVGLDIVNVGLDLAKPYIYIRAYAVQIHTELGLFLSFVPTEHMLRRDRGVARE
jgi:hypothetical protein